MGCSERRLHAFICSDCLLAPTERILGEGPAIRTGHIALDAIRSLHQWTGCARLQAARLLLSPNCHDDTKTTTAITGFLGRCAGDRRPCPRSKHSNTVRLTGGSVVARSLYAEFFPQCTALSQPWHIPHAYDAYEESCSRLSLCFDSEAATYNASGSVAWELTAIYGHRPSYKSVATHLSALSGRSFMSRSLLNAHGLLE